MNYILLLALLALCYFDYADHVSFEQQSLVYKEQIADYRNLRGGFDGKLGEAELENIKLTDSNARLTAANIRLKQDVGFDDAQIADLNARLQTLQKALDEAKSGIEANKQKSFDQWKAKQGTQAVPSNNLGTILTADGKAYQECQLYLVQADGIIVITSDGIVKILYKVMPPSLQKRFGYDPRTGADLTDDQVQYIDNQREAADRAGNDGN